MLAPTHSLPLIAIVFSRDAALVASVSILQLRTQSIKEVVSSKVQGIFDSESELLSYLRVLHSKK